MRKQQCPIQVDPIRPVMARFFSNYLWLVSGELVEVVSDEMMTEFSHLIRR